MWQTFEDPDYYDDEPSYQELEDMDQDALNDELQAANG